MPNPVPAVSRLLYNRITTEHLRNTQVLFCENSEGTRSFRADMNRFLYKKGQKTYGNTLILMKVCTENSVLKKVIDEN